MAKRVPSVPHNVVTKTPEFDVALSFAGEDRDYVQSTAEVLRLMGLRVFYDKYEEVSLWGKNLYDHLARIYGSSARYTIMFISKHYAKKLWTNHERQSAQAKAFLSAGRPCCQCDSTIPKFLVCIRPWDT